MLTLQWWTMKFAWVYANINLYSWLFPPQTYMGKQIKLQCSITNVHLVDLYTRTTIVHGQKFKHYEYFYKEICIFFQKTLNDIACLWFTFMTDLESEPHMLKKLKCTFYEWHWTWFDLSAYASGGSNGEAKNRSCIKLMTQYNIDDSVPDNKKKVFCGNCTRYRKQFPNYIFSKFSLFIRKISWNDMKHILDNFKRQH